MPTTAVHQAHDLITHRLSQRTRADRPNTGGELMELARDIPDVVSLGRGDPDLPTAPHVVEAAVRALRAGHTHYTPRRGLDELREAIATKLRTENAVAVDADREVLITTGTQEAVMVLALALLDPGDEIIMPDPYYFAYEDAIRYAGGHLVTVPTTRSGNFEPDPDDIAAAITARTKALVLLTPNNPTGAVFSRATLQAIADLAIKRNLLVVADELYEKLVFDGAQHISLASLPGMSERTVTINGFSKNYRMTGWRIGYMAGPAQLIAAAQEIKHTLTICAPSMSQHAAVAALTGPQDALAEALQIYAERRSAFTRGLDAVGIPYFEPPGTFYVFADISRSGLTSDEFCLRLLREAAVFAYPGTHFGHYGEGYIRISLLAPVTRLMEGLDRIGRFWKTSLRPKE
jgi:aminotransferase